MNTAGRWIRGWGVHWVLLVCWSILPGLSGVGSAQDKPILSQREIFHPVFAKHGMVVSQEALATGVGVEILKKGGNAVDAAVGVGFALAVTLPQAGNLGGGGFMLIYSADRNSTFALDYRETAPSLATAHMFQNHEGAVNQSRLRFSHQSAGTPGTVAGLSEALRRFGTMSLQEVLAPAIRLTREGLMISAALAGGVEDKAKELGR